MQQHGHAREFKTYYALSAQVAKDLSKEQILECARLLALHVADYQPRFGVIACAPHPVTVARIDALDLTVVMIDSIHFRDRVVPIALSFDSQGKKHVLGIGKGSSEKTQVLRALLSELIERGLNAQRMRLWVIDGPKALRRAISDVFGASAPVQRCKVLYADLPIMPTWDRIEAGNVLVRSA